MKLQENEAVSRRYINHYAMVAALCMPQNFVGILGRASAKTTQFQAMRIQQAVQECPGAPFVWVTDTYSNLHKNVIPSVLEGLRFLGWEQDREFVIDRLPPIEWQRRMYNVIDKYKQVMTFWNGFTFTFVSLDRPSIGAGRSYVGLFGDEVKYWPEEKFTNIRKAVRGYRARYGDSPWYRSLSLTSDMPNPNHTGEYTWVMKLAKLMDKEKVKLLLQTGQVVNEARRRYAECLSRKEEGRGNKYDYPAAGSPGSSGEDGNHTSSLLPLTSSLKNAERNLQRWEQRWLELRRGTTLFMVASTLINADVLGEEFFREELEAGLEGIDTNLLSIPQKLTADQLFYCTLTARDFFHDGIRNDILEQHPYGWEQDASVLRYLDPERPIDGGMDDGNMKSLVIGQQQGREYRVLKELFTLPPDNERQLADRFLDYFRPHRHKLLRLYYDRAMNNYRRTGNSAMQRIKQAIETRADGTRTGWRVQMMSLGQGDIYGDTEYRFFSALFARQLTRQLFTLTIDAQNCPNLKAEMESAPVRVVEDKRTGRKQLRKDKRGERLPAHRLPQESTNLTDALKYLVMRREWLNIWQSFGKNRPYDPK